FVIQVAAFRSYRYAKTAAVEAGKEFDHIFEVTRDPVSGWHQAQSGDWLDWTSALALVEIIREKTLYKDAFIVAKPNGLTHGQLYTVQVGAFRSRNYALRVS